MAVRKKHYSGFHLLVDLALVFLTGGVWLVWILIRFLRSK